MIKILNLGFSYGTVPVLSDITMNLEEGKIYGLLGENGVGKTTLLTLLCGLKKPKEGEIVTDGQRPFDRNPDFLANQFYLPDEVFPVNEKASRWAATLGKFRPEYSQEKFEEIMRLFENDSQKKMNKMSCGQLKKTYISFSLACNAKYLFMDEPTNGLDIPGKAQFRSAVMKYSAEDSVIVISTHQVRDLETIIDPIIILDRNEVLLNASLQSISEKFYFDYGSALRTDSLYSERLPGGFIQVCPNLNGQESKVNIEALFNTAHLHKDIVKEIIK